MMVDWSRCDVCDAIGRSALQATCWSNVLCTAILLTNRKGAQSGDTRNASVLRCVERSLPGRTAALALQADARAREAAQAAQQTVDRLPTALAPPSEVTPLSTPPQQSGRWAIV
jgi:hypothetical protein